MKCHDAKRRLDPFMDGELTVPENLELLAHLDLCRPCAGVFDGEKALRGALKAKLAVGAPSGLADRLIASLEAPVREFRSPRRWAVAAAAGFLLLLAMSMSGVPSRSFTVLAAELSRVHATASYACGEARPEGRCVCRGCCRDVKETIDAFFKERGRPDYCAHLETEGLLGWAPSGCSAWTFQGAQVCGSTWRSPEGGRVSHALVRTRLAAEGRARLLRSGSRWVLLEPKDSTQACVFVFDTESELRRFCAKAGFTVPPAE